jgi:hypothetical protein
MDIDPWGHEPEGDSTELVILFAGLCVAAVLVVGVVEVIKWLA